MSRTPKLGLQESVKLVKKKRSKVDVLDPKSYACFLCEQPALPGTLRNASTFDLDQKVHACAVELNDKGLLVKLASGDLISQEAKYHSKCLVSLYNRCCFAVNARLGKNKNTVCEGLALADIIRFIEETLAVRNESHPVFRMSELRKMYLSRLHDLLFTDSGLTDTNTCNCTSLHNTRLRERILCHFPDMHAQMLVTVIYCYAIKKWAMLSAESVRLTMMKMPFICQKLLKLLEQRC